MDPRWRELARALVDHSTGIQPGERVMIAMVELAVHPLIEAVYEAAVQAGAFPQLRSSQRDSGTVHIALGRAYPDCGGVNGGAVHGDTVKDLRHEGTVTLDGRTVLEGGELQVG